MQGLPKETKMSKPVHRGGLQAWGKWLLLLNAAVPAVSPMQTVSVVDFCGQTLHGDGMVLTSHRDSRRYYFVVASTDCQLTMQAATPKDKVQFQFRFFLVYSMVRSPSSTLASNDHPTLALPKSRSERETPDPCTAGSYVQFYDGQNHTAKPLGMPLCGKNIPQPVTSTGNFLTLRLVTRGQQPRVDFVGDFTSVRTGLNASACSTESYFPCHNGKCFPPSLVCDGSSVDNCGDGTDQAAQSPAWCKGSPTLLPPLNNAEASSAVNALPSQVTCAGPQESQLLPPGTATWDKTGTAVPLLAGMRPCKNLVVYSVPFGNSLPVDTKQVAITVLFSAKTTVLSYLQKAILCCLAQWQLFSSPTHSNPHPSLCWDTAREITSI
ncbi:low-density lipoprotein receptor class A domain-containing protein 2-like isoform X1 [Podarcis muralis]